MVRRSDPVEIQAGLYWFAIENLHEAILAEMERTIYLEADGEVNLRIMAKATAASQFKARAKVSGAYTTLTVADWMGNGLKDIPVEFHILAKVQW